MLKEKEIISIYMVIRTTLWKIFSKVKSVCVCVCIQILFNHARHSYVEQKKNYLEAIDVSLVVYSRISSNFT